MIVDTGAGTRQRLAADMPLKLRCWEPGWILVCVLLWARLMVADRNDSTHAVFGSI